MRRSVPLLALVLASMFGAGGASAQTNVSGTLNSNTTWGLAGSPYVLTGDVTVANGRTLSIEAGVVVQFPNTSWDLLVDGALVVQGVSGNPVTFAGPSAASPGGSVVLLAGSANSVIDYANFIRLGSAAAFYDAGLSIQSSSAVVRDCSFQECGYAGLRVPVEVKPVVSNATFVNGSGLDSEVHPTAPTNFSNVGGKITLRAGANAVTVAQGAWPMGVYELGADVLVSFGSTLTVGAGAEVLFPNTSWDLLVDGTLVVQGVSGNPVTFGGASAASPGASVVLMAASANSVIDHSQFVHLGSAAAFYDAGLSIQSASAVVRDCSFRECGYAGLRVPVEVKPVVTNATFINNGVHDAEVHPTSPTNFSNVGGKITLRGGTNDVTVSQAVWPTGVYELGGDVSVSFGSTLTIAAGAEVRFPNTSWDLLVSGSLHAVGLESEKVRFVGPGGGIFGASVALLGSRANCSIDHAIFGSLGSAASFYDAGLYLASSSCSVTNCEFTNNGFAGLRIPVEVTPIVSQLSFEGSATHDALVHPSAPTNFSDIKGLITLNGGSNSIEIPDARWPRADYLLGADVTVAQTGGLTIDAGAHVAFPNASWDLIVSGALEVAGKNDERVRFLGPGSGAFGASLAIMSAAPKAIVRNADFRSLASAASVFDAALHVATDSLVLVEGCDFVDSQIDAVRVVTNGPNVSISKSNFEGIGQFAVRNTGTGTVVATNDWWNSPTGPSGPSNPGGTGEAISGSVTFAPPLSVANRFTLTPSQTTAPPGSTLILTTANGCSGCPVGLFLVSVNGEPSTIATPIVIGSFAPTNDWSFSSVVPPGLVGITAEFRAYGNDVCSDLAGTPVVAIQF